MNFALHGFVAAGLSNAALVVPLALLVTIICRLIRRPAVAWCLWALVLLKFVTPAWYPLVDPVAWNSFRASPMLAWVETHATQPSPDSSLFEHNTAAIPDSSGWGEAKPRWIDDSPALAPIDKSIAAPVTPAITDATPIVEASLDNRDAMCEFEADSPPPPPFPVWNDESVASSASPRSQAPASPRSQAPASPRSQAPAWERTFKKLRFVSPSPSTSPSGSTFPAQPTEATVPIAKQSFADVRSQTEFGNEDARGNWDKSTPAAANSRGAGESPTYSRFSPGNILIAVWGSGAAILFLLAAVRVRRFRKLLRHAAAPAPVEFVESAKQLAAKLGCRSVPGLLMTTARVPPLLWGIGRRAVIVLPLELLDELDDEQRTAVLAHELAHFVRRDHWVRWFELAVRSVYWWHPVAWLAGRKLREAEEQCCDAWVVRLLTGPDAPRRYADALLKTVDFLTATAPDPIGGLTSPARRAAAVPPLASGITPCRIRRSVRPFHRRLTMLIHHRPNPQLSWPARLCLLALAAAVLPASITAVGEDGPTSTTDESTAKTPNDANERRVHEATRNAPADGDADAIPEPSAADAVHSTPLHTPYQAAASLNDARDDTADQSPEGEGRPAESPSAGGSPSRDTTHPSNELQVRQLPNGIKVAGYRLVHNDPAAVSHLLVNYFESADTPPTISPGTKETVPSLKPHERMIIVRGTDEQHQFVTFFLAKLNATAPKAASAERDPLESITVVRATYELPYNVAEAVHEFIQQNGQSFDFLTSVVTSGAESPVGALGRPFGDLVGDDRSRLGGTFLNAPSGARGMAGMLGIASSGLSATVNSVSRLTIIATPEVQQQFGDFIAALKAPPKPEAAEEAQKPADAPQTLTLVRAKYKFKAMPGGEEAQPTNPFSGTNPFGGARLRRSTDFERQQLESLYGKGSMAGAKTGLDIAGIASMLGEPSALGANLRHSPMGFGVLNLLTAVKESHLVPLLLVSADAEGLTVTTTEEFQQALGKFIRFLQEHEAKAADKPESGASLTPEEEQLEREVEGRLIERADTNQRAREASETPAHRDESARAFAELRRQAGLRTLKKAREALDSGDIGLARSLVSKAQQQQQYLHEEDDRPQLVLRDIEAREAGKGSTQQESIYSGPVIPVDGKTELGAAQLAMTRYREAEISAKLLALQEMLKRGTVNKPAMLLALGREEANNPVWTMLRELVELETTAQDRKRTQGLGTNHPTVVELQTKIDIKRKSLGLPTGDDTPPLDLFDLYLKSLEHQLETSRAVIQALEANGKQQLNTVPTY